MMMSNARYGGEFKHAGRKNRGYMIDESDFDIDIPPYRELTFLTLDEEEPIGMSRRR